MTLESTRKNLGPFYAEISPAILDGGNSALRNPGEFGKLALAQFLESAKNPDRFAHGNFDSLSWQDEIPSYQDLRQSWKVTRTPGSRGRLAET